MISVKWFVGVLDSHQNNLADIFWKLQFFAFTFQRPRKEQLRPNFEKAEVFQRTNFSWKSFQRNAFFPYQFFNVFDWAKNKLFSTFITFTLIENNMLYRYYNTWNEIVIINSIIIYKSLKKGFSLGVSNNCFRIIFGSFKIPDVNIMYHEDLEKRSGRLRGCGMVGHERHESHVLQ